MQKDLIFREKDPQEHFGRVLEQTLKEGAQRLFQQAIENEVQEYLDGYRDTKTEGGRRSIVRNGYLPQRSVLTGIGLVSLKQPRGYANNCPIPKFPAGFPTCHSASVAMSPCVKRSTLYSCITPSRRV